MTGCQPRDHPAILLGVTLVLAGTILVAALRVVGAAPFVLTEWFFVRVMGVGGPGLGRDFGLALPVMVIALGSRVVARGLRHGR